MTEVQTPSVVCRPETVCVGDEIEVWLGGRLEDTGTVSRTLPSVGMAWIVCARTGTLMLVDLADGDIVRVPAALRRVGMLVSPTLSGRVNHHPPATEDQEVDFTVQKSLASDWLSR